MTNTGVRNLRLGQEGHVATLSAKDQIQIKMTKPLLGLGKLIVRWSFPLFTTEDLVPTIQGEEPLGEWRNRKDQPLIRWG